MTDQFEDYSKYVSTAYSQEEKEKRRKEEFPIDCKKAFYMGARLVVESRKENNKEQHLR